MFWGAHRALCACCAKSRLFSTTGGQFLGCMIGIGTHTALSQCTIAIVHNCSIILPPLVVCTLANGHPELGLW